MALGSNGAHRKNSNGSIMKIFVTGATGFVGASVVRLAIEAGHDVTGAVRPNSSKNRLKELVGKFNCVEIDLCAANSASSLLCDIRPDVIIHLAWYGVENNARFDPKQITYNVDASCQLVNAAVKNDVKAFIGIGSQGEYGAGSEMKEISCPKPTTLYGAAKVATLYLTQQLAFQGQMRHAWVRIFSTYGPKDNDVWLIPSIINQIQAGIRPKTTLGTQYWDWLYITDVANAILAVATTETASGVFNLGSGRAVQVRRVIELIKDYINPNMELVFGEIPFREDQVMFMQADIERIMSHTNWEPRVNLEDGLRATVEWYKANNYES